MTEWEIRRGDTVLAHGVEETFPTPEERRRFLADGYRIFVDGKRYTGRKAVNECTS